MNGALALIILFGSAALVMLVVRIRSALEDRESELFKPERPVGEIPKPPGSAMPNPPKTSDSFFSSPKPINEKATNEQAVNEPSVNGDRGFSSDTPRTSPNQQIVENFPPPIKNFINSLSRPGVDRQAQQKKLGRIIAGIIAIVIILSGVMGALENSSFGSTPLFEFLSVLPGLAIIFFIVWIAKHSKKKK